MTPLSVTPRPESSACPRPEGVDEQLLREYAGGELGSDGYPPVWHQMIKHLVREQAGHRCIRCRHPYRNGAHGSGEWSPCDEHCRHGGPVRWSNGSSWERYDGPDETIAQHVEAAWRILTVHHLDGNKANCRWWNLAALCQRCHLRIQGRVRMKHPYWGEHSKWFKPYAAGYYAHRFLDKELTREQTEGRLEELLALEHRQLDLQAALPGRARDDD